MIERNARFLMANLGSEVSRLLDWKKKGDIEMAKKCLNRAEQIIRQIRSFPEMAARAGEIDILADVIEDEFRPKPKFHIESQTLKEYFYPFAQKIVK